MSDSTTQPMLDKTTELMLADIGLEFNSIRQLVQGTQSLTWLRAQHTLVESKLELIQEYVNKGILADAPLSPARLKIKLARTLLVRIEKRIIQVEKRNKQRSTSRTISRAIADLQHMHNVAPLPVIEQKQTPVLPAPLAEIVTHVLGAKPVDAIREIDEGISINESAQQAAELDAIFGAGVIKQESEHE